MEPTVIGPAIVTGIIRETIRHASLSLTRKIKEGPNKWAWDEGALSTHLQWVASWSASMQVGDMSTPIDVDDGTVPARLLEGSGRYIRESDSSPAISERDLLLDPHTYLITGEPGGGKTTAIKRLARILLHEPDGPETWQYPVVVLLRDLPKKQSLVARIGSLLGLRFDVPNVEQIETLSHVVRCGTESLLQAVVRAISDTKAVVLLDGLDELDISERKHVEYEIQDIAQLLPNGKLILSARTGSVERVFENVRRVQVAPLQREGAISIAKLWLSDPIEFFVELDRTPYHDLARRPLFLVRLLLLFKRLRSLPSQACDVYDRFIRLLLEDWDRERDVRRSSRYANFGPDQKMRFLAALSHHLLLETRSVSFSRFDLEHAYVQLSSQYQLPELQAEQVVEEIVSHTGLIVPARFGHYEFSHLSLQEYLCAHHIVRDPLLSNRQRYLATYPAPLAIAATMAANPSAFLASLVLTEEVAEGTSWDIFFQRLEYERPRFVCSDLLGLAALKLISENAQFIYGFFSAFKSNNDGNMLLKCMGMSLSAYEAVETLPLGWVVFQKVSDLGLAAPLTQPQTFRLPESLVAKLLAQPGVRLVGRSSSQHPIVLRTNDGHIRLS